MTKKTITLGILAGALMMSPLSTRAQPADTPVQRPMQKMIRELNLTPDQKTKLKALRGQMKDVRQQIVEQMKGIRNKIKEELLKDKPSEKTLDGYAAQLGELSKQIAQKMSSHLLQVKAILTPEQFKKMVSFDWMDQFMKRKGKHGPGAGGGDPDEM